MLYAAHHPGPALRGIVDYFWSLADAPGHARERILPSGTLEFVFNLDQDEFCIHDPRSAAERRFPGAIASGCYARAFEIDTRVHAHVVGVHFEPGGAARLLGVPAGELANSHVALQDLWGRRAPALRERLCEASSAEQRFQLLEQELVGRLSKRAERRSSVTAALVEFERTAVEVGDVAARVGLSRRRFIEVFTDDVGMTPKRYAMVRRFQRALALVTREPVSGWTEVALDSGYYDHAHLCRDFSEITGLSPSAFSEQRRVPVKENHVAVPEGSNPSKTSVRRGTRL